MLIIAVYRLIRGREAKKKLSYVWESLSLDKNIQTDIVYLDFAKAFDSVDHQILLQKLKSYGVRGQLYKLVC